MTTVTNPALHGYAATATRAGILTAPVAGALKLLGNLGTFNSVGYGIPQADEAAVAVAPSYLLGQLVGSVLPTVLTPFWVFALAVYLAPRIRARRMLTAAMVAFVLGAGFALAALGVVSYAIPALAHAYDSGNTAAMSIADNFFAWPGVAMFLPAVLVPLGTLLLAAAVWRTAALPRTCVFALVVAAVLISAPGPIHSLHLAGGVLTLATGTWLAYLVRANTPTQPQSTDAAAGGAGARAIPITREAPPVP